MVKKTSRPPNAQGPSRGGGSGGNSSTYFGLAALVGVVAISFIFPSSIPDFSPEASKASGGSASRSKSSKSNKSKLSFDLNKTLERSSKAIKNQDFERAGKLAARAAVEQPDSWAAWMNLGLAKRYGDGARGVLPAVDAFEKAVALNPSLPDAHTWLASALSCTPRQAAARTAAFQSLALNPNSVEALVAAAKLTNFSDPATDAGAEPVMEKLVGRLASHHAAAERKAAAEEEDADSSAAKAAAMGEDSDLLMRGDRIKLHFALFAALDEAGEVEKAAPHLTAANQLKHELQVYKDLVEGNAHPQWARESTAHLMNELVAAFQTAPKPAGADDVTAALDGDVTADVTTKGDAVDGKAATPPPPPLAQRLPHAITASVGFERDYGEAYCRSLVTGVGVKPKKKKLTDGKDKESGDHGDGDAAAESESDEEVPFVRPLFVVGMPRSGQGLLAQLLTSHSNVLQGDDYNFLAASIQMALSKRVETAKAAGQSFGVSDQISLLAHDEEALEELHQSYLTLLHRDVATAASEAAQVAQPANEDGSSTTPKGGAGPQYDAQGKGGGSGKGGGWLSSLLGSSGSGSAKDENAEPPLLYAVDKMHSNTWWVGSVPPCAKVIAVRRAPMDTGFSNLKTGFASAGFEFTYNQTELGWRLALTDRIIDAWEAVMPPESMLTITYDELVANTTTTVNRAFDFLGVARCDSCADPKTSPAIATGPGNVVLRRPVAEQAARSTKRWERYASSVEDLIVSHSEAKRWVEYVTDSDGPGDWLSRGAGLKLQQAQEAEEAAAAAKGASSKSSSSLLGRSGLNAAMGAGQPGAAGASTTALRLLEEIEKEKQAAQKRAEDAQDAQDLLEEAAEAEAEAAAKEIADSMMMEKEAGTA